MFSQTMVRRSCLVVFLIAGTLLLVGCGREDGRKTKERVVLPPLSTRQFVVPDKDRSGGAWASFLVKWEAKTRVSRPIIEALMISISGQQGISFTTQGSVVRVLR